MSKFIAILIFTLFTACICNEEKSTENQYYKRVIQFNQFQINYQVTKPGQQTQKYQLISPLEENTGSVFFAIKLKRRGWKLTLRDGGIKLNLHNLGYNPVTEIIKDHKGKVTMLEDNVSLHKIHLFKPKQDTIPDFEVSQLQNYCWRVDIFRDTEEMGKEILHINYCLDQNDPNLAKARKYSFLLDSKELGEVNKE